MDIENFQKALAFTLRWEGGYVNNPADPGGETNYGITNTVYQAWLSAQKLSPKSIKDITSSEVRDIYLQNYWTSAKCDQISWPMNLAVFDFAVNAGVGSAAKKLQECMLLPADGIIGPLTLGAITAELDLDSLTDLYLAKRKEYYTSLAKMNPVLKKFWQGWINRVDDLQKYIGENS